MLADKKIWTETDVRADSWFLREGRVPAGILIEAGQADLFLISYLGADFLNRDERKYRMLSCDVTFHGDLPKAGDTLYYDIHVDGHAKLGDIRIFFFHFDCRVNGELRLSMRGGQAGFFTDRELAESAGVLWSAETASAPARRQARSSNRSATLDLFATSRSRPSPRATPTNVSARI